MLPVRQTCPHTLALLQRRQRRHQPCPLLRADRCRPSKVAACSVGRAAWLRSPPVTRDTHALLAVWRPSSTTSSSTRASACPCRKLDRCCGARCARGIACRSDLALSGCARNELPALVPSRKSAHSSSMQRHSAEPARGRRLRTLVLIPPQVLGRGDRAPGLQVLLHAVHPVVMVPRHIMSLASEPDATRHHASATDRGTRDRGGPRSSNPLFFSI